MDTNVFAQKATRFIELESLIQQPGLYNDPAQAADYL